MHYISAPYKTAVSCKKTLFDTLSPKVVYIRLENLIIHLRGEKVVQASTRDPRVFLQQLTLPLKASFQLKYLIKKYELVRHGVFEILPVTTTMPKIARK
jgi:hypothetical protein